jgi:mRNA interferase MazF
MQSVTFRPLTSDVTIARTFRGPLEPGKANGLRLPSHVMADKCTSPPRQKVGPVFGRLSDDDMAAVTGALAIFLGIV